MIAALGVAVIGVLILSVIVFGGGQVFIPLFKSLWTLMGQIAGNELPDLTEQINTMITAANVTPGVVSTKFALFTGYVVANGEWWGWISMILTYVIFTTPAIILMLVGMKLVKKSSKNVYLKNMIIFLRPVISGVLVALAVQLFISITFPDLIFNGSQYIGLEPVKNNFFTGWRFWLLIVWSPFVIIESFILYKKKVPLLPLILGHVIVAIIIFAPWLT